VIEDNSMSSALAPAQLIAHDTGVSASPSRRLFTAAYKRSILRDAARCSQPGDVAALLRREGLYSSHLAAWRTAIPVDPQTKRVAELERQLAKATARAERAEGLVALQKTVAELCGQTLDTPSESR
jgi:transposase